jgi:hypothetical protein
MLTEPFIVGKVINKNTLIFGSLAMVALILVSSVAASALWPKDAETNIEVDLPPDFDPPFEDEDADALTKKT